MSRHAAFKFILFVAGDTENSALALANLSAFCRTRLPNRHEIEVVDVIRQPKRAMKEGIFMTPTLVKTSPSPVRIIVGTLSDTHTVLEVLGLGDVAA
jgi:circadian clock protein KaiB